MKYTYILYMLLFIPWVWIGCSDDETTLPDTEQNEYLVFEASINGETEGVDENTLWPVNNMIGLFVTTPENKSVINDYQNVRYISQEGEGIFLPANYYTDIIHYPAGHNTVNIIGYSPYQEEAGNGIYKIDLSQQSRQEAIDLLYADIVTSPLENNKVNLDFQHQLSKIVFTIQAGSSLTNLADLKVTVTNLKTEADYYLIDRTFTERGENAEIVMKTTAGERSAVSEGIILPAEAASRKFLVRIRIGTDNKTFEIDASEERFEKGKKNIYNITLERNEVDITVDSTIEDWGLGSSETIILNPDENGDVEYLTHEFFSETFGVPVDPLITAVYFDEYNGFDMQAPVSYSSTGVRLQLQTMVDRFEDNGYFLTMLVHSGVASSDKNMIIDGIPGSGYFDMELTYDYAAGDGMNFNDLTLKCNDVVVALPDQVVKNRDRFEPVVVRIPDGTTKIEFLQDRQTASYMRIDNVKITGTTIVRKTN